MHEYGAENYKNIAELHLRETCDVSPTLKLVIFGKMKQVPIFQLPDILRRRFAG